MHHIVVDDFSEELFLQDLMALYTGKTLPVLKLQYKDFSAWQNQLLRSEKIRSQEELTEKLFTILASPRFYYRTQL